MSRLPALTYDDTDEAQRAVWDSVIASRSGLGDMTDATGSLRGPFHAMSMRPHLGAPMVELGRNVRFESSLPSELLEIAICTVGAHWTSEFEFWAHRRLAKAAGVDDSILDAIAAGVRPVFANEQQAVVYQYTHELVSTGHISTDTWQAVVDEVGYDSAVDLTVTVGYYSQISFLLNAFDVQLPPGATPTWAPPR